MGGGEGEPERELERTVMNAVVLLYVVGYIVVSASIARFVVRTIDALDPYVAVAFWLVAFVAFLIATRRARDRQLQKRGIE